MACEGGDGHDVETPAPDGGSHPEAGAEPVASDAGPEPIWEDCLSGLECAVVVVPMDHDDATVGTLELTIVRYPVTAPTRGTVVYLAGGPGGTSVSGVRGLGPKLPEWTVVGMDHRGSELSSPKIDCGDDTGWDAIAALDTSPDDDVGRAALDAAATAWASACVAGTTEALLARVDSVSAARDLDDVRRALRAERISAYSVSYGTLLAAHYVRLFPEHVEAFVLDSPVEPTTDAEQQYRTQAASYEAGLRDFFGWCGADATCAFHGGTGDAAVTSAFESLWPSLEALGRVSDRILLQHLSDGRWPALADALAGAEGGATDGWVALYPPPARRPDGTYTNSVGVHQAVTQTDRPWPADSRTAFYALVQDVASTVAPHTASPLSSHWFTAGLWPVRPAKPPAPLTASTAPPLLLVAGEADPVTPIDNAVALQQLLANGSYLLTVAGPGHGQVLRNPCALDATLAFLDDPTVAPASSRCP